jgi:hypothetical protein
MGKSDLLFAPPSFTEGVARILDLGGTLTEFNSAPSGLWADRLAIRSDWRAVGHDLAAIMRRRIARNLRSGTA